MRPQDYGDQNPSDSGDQAPVSPTDGFTELDYDIKQRESKGYPVEMGRDLVPEAGIENPEPHKADGWAGLVTEILNEKDAWPRLFRVILRTGKLITAKAYSMLNSEVLKIGDDVTVMVDNTTEEYIISSGHRQREGQILDAETQWPRQSAEEQIVWFDQTNTKIPIDDAFTDGEHEKIKLEPDGKITVRPDGSAVYEINFSICVAVVKNEDLPGKIYLAQECFNSTDYWGSYFAETKYSKLAFNTYNGFKLSGADGCGALVSMGSNIADSVLNQQGTENGFGSSVVYPAKWTDGPKFGGSTQISSTTSGGWLKIGPWYNHVWLSGPMYGGKLKLRLPSRSPHYKYSFLIAHNNGLDEGNLGLGMGGTTISEWLRPGCTGQVTLQTGTIFDYTYCYHDTGYCAIPRYVAVTLDIRHGLIYDIIGSLVQKEIYGGGTTPPHYDPAPNVMTPSGCE